jgi:NAD(P)-dependent dehydrogenase (short-subunit alcohol dehydrogenase family)
MKRFENKHVVVTGSSEGVGRHIAIGYAKEGAKVILVNRRKPEETIKLIEYAGGTCDYVLCDISDEHQVIQMGKEVAEKLDGRIDILMNNAGLNGKVSLVRDMKLSDWETTIKVNLTGTMMVCRELIPYLIKSEAAKIINMASNVGKRGLPLRSDYVCSKWALLGFTQTLALELVDYNIRVNAVCPGPIEGDRIEQIVKMHADIEGKSTEEMHKEWEQVPMKRFVTPKEVTDVVLFLSSEESSAMTGQALNITGGFIMN